MEKDVHTMATKRTRGETMDKNHSPLHGLAEQYFITCRTEGKTASTLRTYREKLGRFVGWAKGAILLDFLIELVREYISYLQTALKYEGHPFHRPHDANMSAAHVRNHVRVLRSFASWLYREDYTADYLLARLKVPKAPRKVLETLSEEEIRRLFDSLDQNIMGVAATPPFSFSFWTRGCEMPNFYISASMMSTFTNNGLK